MTYTPINANVFSAAYKGAFAGMSCGSSGVIKSTNSNDYTSLASYAGAWAQEFDTLWNSVSVDSLELGLIEDQSFGAWQGRAPFPLSPVSTVFNVPAKYAGEINAIIATITAAEAYYSGQGIPIPANTATAWTDVNANTVVGSTGGNYEVDSSGGPVSVTLPTAPVNGTQVVIRVGGAISGNPAANNVTILAGGADNISQLNGVAAASLVLGTIGQSVTLSYDPAQTTWWIS